MVRDDYDASDLDGITRGGNVMSSRPTETAMSSSSENSLNSTIDLKDSTGNGSMLDNSSSPNSSSSSTSHQQQSASGVAPQTPVDESAPFNFDLNADYYLYTNPVIMLTFSGCQTIKLTVNNMKPTDLMMMADANMLGIKDQQRPFLEVSAQFGAIKSLLCPKQIHLLSDMVTKLTDYVEAANACKKALRLAQQRQRYLRRAGKLNTRRIILNYV